MFVVNYRCSTPYRFCPCVARSSEITVVCANIINLFNPCSKHFALKYGAYVRDMSFINKFYVSASVYVSYNTGKSTLLDLPKAECVYIKQSTSAYVITNMLHFQHSKIFPKLTADISASLYSNGCSL